jgi:hypothetical protein
LKALRSCLLLSCSLVFSRLLLCFPVFSCPLRSIPMSSLLFLSYSLSSPLISSLHRLYLLIVVRTGVLALIVRVVLRTPFLDRVQPPVCECVPGSVVGWFSCPTTAAIVGAGAAPCARPVIGVAAPGPSGPTTCVPARCSRPMLAGRPGVVGARTPLLCCIFFCPRGRISTGYCSRARLF